MARPHLLRSARQCAGVLGVASLLAGAPAAWAAPDPLSGQKTFEQVCAACHQPGGLGAPGVAPALAGPLAPLLASPEGKVYITGVLTQGLSGRIQSAGQTFMGAMATQAGQSDEDLAAVATYLAQALNGLPDIRFTPEEVSQARSAKLSHKALRALRDKLLP
jgi:mono/diheme cytochrome c family protein